jgi:hypothetical protein
MILTACFLIPSYRQDHKEVREPVGSPGRGVIEWEMLRATVLFSGDLLDWNRRKDQPVNRALFFPPSFPRESMAEGGK